MPYKRGDVVLVLYPHADLRTAKKHPALVPHYSGRSLTTDLCLLTSVALTPDY